MDTKGLVLHLLLLLTIFTLPGESTLLRDLKLGKKEPTIPEESAQHLRATDKDKVTEIFDTLVKPTAADLSETLLAKAKDTVESVFQHKDEFLAKTKDKLGSSLKEFEEEGASLLSRAKEKVGSTLQENEVLLAMAKNKVGSALKTIEQDGSHLLARAKGKMETNLQERDELVAKAKGRIGGLIEKKDEEVPQEISLLQKAKDKIHTSFRTFEDERESLVAKAKEKVQNSMIVQGGSNLLGKAKETIENPPIFKPFESEGTNLLAKTKDTIKAFGSVPQDDGQFQDTSLLTKAKESMEKSLLMRTLGNGDESILGKAKQKVENSLLRKTLKEHESYIRNRAKETVDSARKFNLLGAKPLNSLFPSYGSNTPKIAGLKLLPIKEDPIVEVDDFHYPIEEPKEILKESPKTPEVCYARPLPKDEEPIVPILPENKPLDFEKINDGYYQDSREFHDNHHDYEEVLPEYLPENFKRFSSDDYYGDEYSEGRKGQKRHISYDRLFRKSKSKSKTSGGEEIHEHFKRGIGNVKKIIDIAGQVDSFFSGKIRNSLKTLSQIYENEDEYKYGNR